MNKKVVLKYVFWRSPRENDYTESMLGVGKRYVNEDQEIKYIDIRMLIKDYFVPLNSDNSTKSYLAIYHSDRVVLLC